jgi:peptide/nickel transport system substrate-binding protein
MNTLNHRYAHALVIMGLLVLVVSAMMVACATPTAAPTAVPPTAAAKSSAPSAVTSVAPTAAPAVKQPKAGGTLTIGTNQDAVGFDPHLSNATASYRIFENVYNGLLTFNDKLEVQPDLAESYTIDSPTQYTFKLRKGVKFHNGRELKAADVKYSIERIADEKTASPRRSNFAPLDKIETPDDYTVVIKLKNPYSPLLSILADRSTAIVAKEVVDANGGKLDKVMVGTGPFKFVEYIPNTRTKLEKNPDYFIKGQPLLDTIIYQPIPDDTARSTAVRTGAVDMIEYAPAKDLALFKSDSKIVLTGEGNNNVRYLAFNTKVKPFDNVKVRQAIAWAVDRKPVMEAAVSGAGTPLMAGPFLPSFWPGLQQPYYKQDLAKAKQLLAEAGYPNGFKAKLKNTPTYAFLGNAGIVVQEQLKAVGIEFEIISLEWSVFLRDYMAKDVEAFVSGFSAFTDPHPALDGMFVTGRQNNFMNYSNPKFDDLWAKAATISDQSERAKLYREAQTILLEDSPMVYLYAANEYEAMQSYVKGYVHYVNGSHVSFRTMWLDK